MENNYEILEVLNPVAPASAAEYKVDYKVVTLGGKSIGLFWNRKPNGDMVLSRFGELLKNRYPDIKIEWLQGKNDPAQSALEAALKEASEKCDFVILAAAD